MGRIKLAMAWATAGLLTFLIGETLNKSSAAGEQIFCPHAAVSKVGNTYSSTLETLPGNKIPRSQLLPIESELPKKSGSGLKKEER